MIISSTLIILKSSGWLKRDKLYTESVAIVHSCLLVTNSVRDFSHTIARFEKDCNVRCVTCRNKWYDLYVVNKEVYCGICAIHWYNKTWKAVRKLTAEKVWDKKVLKWLNKHNIPSSQNYKYSKQTTAYIARYKRGL